MSRLCRFPDCGRVRYSKWTPLCSGHRAQHLRGDALRPIHPNPETTSTYRGIHQKVIRTHGRASSWTCAGGCGNQASHWALVVPRGSASLPKRGADRRYLIGRGEDDYSPLCALCHKGFDNSWREK